MGRLPNARFQLKIKNCDPDIASYRNGEQGRPPFIGVGDKPASDGATRPDELLHLKRR